MGNTLTFTHPDPGGVTSTIPTEPNGKINRYIMPFNDQKDPKFAAYSSLYQAQQMLANFQKIITENPKAKIAITYSANETQAEKLMAGYTSNDDQSSILTGGANQATIFQELIKLLQQEPELKNKIHILPIATMPAGDSTQPASEENVKKYMANIAKHLGADWIVLGLCNQHTPHNTYAIGGGIAGGWKNSKQKKLCDDALTFMTDNPLTADQPTDNDITYLKTAFADGQQSPDSLLVPILDQTQTNFPPPIDPAFGVNSDLMKQITVNDWQTLFNEIFQVENNPEKITQGYKGTICKNNENLVHFTDRGLICPIVNNTKEQAEIIAQSLQLIKKKNNIPDDQPLVVTASNFSVKELAIIITELQAKNINVQFNITKEKDPDVINLIKTKNVLYKPSTPTPPASKKSPILPIPTLTAKPTKKLLQEEKEYELFNIADDGNCLFASIIHQLDTRNLNNPPNNLDRQLLREQIADYISNHWDGEEDGVVFKNFIRDAEQKKAGINPQKNPEEFTAEDKEKYIKYIKQDQIWGDEASIIAASKILNVNIAIKTQLGGEHNKFFKAPQDHQIRPTIYLWHQPEVHYQSYFAKTDPNLPPPKKPKL